MSRISSAVLEGWKTVEERLANPLVRRLLRSRAHRIASHALAVLAYEGRVSGRGYEIPVAYARRDRTVVVLTPREATTWWKNFREPSECTLHVRGHRRSAVGEVVTDPAEGRALGAIYARQRPVLSRLLGVDPAPNPFESRVTQDFAIVRFSLERR
ncbi:hypothetical protein [Natrarchaeobius chitinivorans]|uniref:DUF385 domain-containing protein n=1 Tax=Natrarchaeobius chitinivorans TaxID=1679083 RepID=A0A3N6MHL0_NATCH|nr:hypothetical protein [Natrarchaeobius chitinivorans]RQG95101.1 hypothetical protein EA473_09110 [Natrarchaeobius chitinivorans]